MCKKYQYLSLFILILKRFHILSNFKDNKIQYIIVRYRNTWIELGTYGLQGHRNYAECGEKTKGQNKATSIKYLILVAGKSSYKLLILCIYTLIA